MGIAEPVIGRAFARPVGSTILRAFAPRNDVETYVCDLAARSARVLLRFLPSENRGRRECRALDAPAAACVVVESTRVSHHGHTGNTRHSPRNGFNGFLRALPGDRACLPPSPADLSSAKLDASVGASGPHDFAVRKVSALVSSAARVHRIPPRVRDDREPPLCEAG
jgi:hypothetical protein